MPEGKRGAQKGSRNARKHGFYSRSLTTSEICEFLNTTNFHGTDREIAVLRVKLKSVLQHSPANHRVFTEAAGLLVNSYCAKFHLDPMACKQLQDSPGEPSCPCTLTKQTSVKSAGTSYSDNTNQTCFYLYEVLLLTKDTNFKKCLLTKQIGIFQRRL